ncbi:DUF402 domain-containing protein [Micromonospora siamensis]|uniref:DUF402 domain-containing protein n=1 Tax=Micromonospora siamensis TaxID=299152 RepID=A0A1C5HT35_9ACTN|nr:DUF402 domain-containing protein [Micromonospora siamensis]SCG49196.1 Protein of unknown function [Micromonospora siamensis]
MRRVRLFKVKRPGGVYWFDLEPFAEDADGTWLRGAAGSPWGGPDHHGVLSLSAVVLVAVGRPWAAWWVADPGDRRLEIDVCLPAERAGAGWRYVDLELDPVRHEQDSRVEIEDWDEYEVACREGWMSGDDGMLARAVAEERAEALRRREEPWQERGWRLLDSAGPAGV